MKVIRPLQLALVVAAAVVIVPAAHAGSRCTDDPERCVERGASASRPAARSVVSAPVISAQPASVVPAARKVVAMRKVTPKPARVTPTAPAAPAPTPGMGMLLKLSTGTGGDVSWQPGARSTDNTGASWIL